MGKSISLHPDPTGTCFLNLISVPLGPPSSLLGPSPSSWGAVTLCATIYQPATGEMPSIPSVLGLSRCRTQVRAVAVSAWSPYGNIPPTPHPSGGPQKKVLYDQGVWEAVRGWLGQHLLRPPAGVGRHLRPLSRLPYSPASPSPHRWGGGGQSSAQLLELQSTWGAHWVFDLHPQNSTEGNGQGLFR